MWYVYRQEASNCCTVNAMTAVKIGADPIEALVDEKVWISVNGLSPNEPVTIKASLDEDNKRFSSYGCYISTERGQVDLGTQPSLHGTYTGVDPVGLLWSMSREPCHEVSIRFQKNDVTTPVVVNITVFKGHITWENLFDPHLKPLAGCQIYRRYMAKSVRREKVRQGNIRGVLFTPPGPGPFRGVIDMFGSGGGLFEHRAALLASRGFCVLALAFFDYEDLTTALTDITLDYFIEATEWFSKLPRVLSTGIGVLGLSKSGEFALEMARHCPSVKAVVLVNAVSFYSAVPLKFSKGDIPNTEFQFDGIVQTPNGLDLTKAQIPTDNFFIKAWESNASVLCIVGEDDHCLNPQLTDQFLKLVPKEHRHRFHVIKYPGAGHLIEPPFAPHCVASFHKQFGFYFIYWGGETKDHSYAQEDSWRRILQFFSVQLVPHDFVQEKCKL